MGVATATVVVLMLLCVTFAVLAAIRAARAVNRGVERASNQVRRGIDDTTIRFKAAQPGPVGQVARIRLDMRAAVDNARRELTEGVHTDGSLHEALGLLDQLHDHARVLDRELAGLMDREPDRVRIAARLPEVRARAEEIKESADALRLAAQDRARRHDVDGLTSLRQQIDIESGALRHWTPVEDPKSGDPKGGSRGPAEAADGASGLAGTSPDGAASTAARGVSGDAVSGDSATQRPRRAVEGSPQGEGGNRGLGSLWDGKGQFPGFRQNRRSKDVG